MYGIIVEPLGPGRARFITSDGVAILEVVGLDDSASPMFTITQTCGDCGKVVSSTEYDVTKAPPNLDVFTNGEALADAMLAHWAAHGGDDADAMRRLWAMGSGRELSRRRL